MTREECLRAVVTWQEEHGRWPQRADWGSGGLPTRADLAAHWRSKSAPSDCLRAARRLTQGKQRGQAGGVETIDATPLKPLIEDLSMTQWEGLKLSRRSYYALKNEEQPRLSVWTVDKILTTFGRPDIWHVELATA